MIPSTYIESDTTSRSPHSSPSGRRARTRRRIGGGAALVSALLLLVVLVYFGAQQFAADSRPPHNVIPGEEKPWKLEVVNIAGDDGLAGRMTRYLRRLGYDVVDFHSRQMPGHERTVLIDRTGDPTAAQDIAARLGIDEERITTEIDRSLFVDVTVVLGFDYQTFPTLKHLRMKDTP